MLGTLSHRQGGRKAVIPLLSRREKGPSHLAGSYLLRPWLTRHSSSPRKIKPPSHILL